MDDCNFIHYNFEELVLLFYYLHFLNGYSSSNVATSNLEIDQYVKKKRETEERIIIMIRSFVLVIFIIFRDISNDEKKNVYALYKRRKGMKYLYFGYPVQFF
jgi:hypothetical protein